jgi:mannan endo-1,4-beta-mannosidase
MFAYFLFYTLSSASRKCLVPPTSYPINTGNAINTGNTINSGTGNQPINTGNTINSGTGNTINSGTGNTINVSNSVPFVTYSSQRSQFIIDNTIFVPVGFNAYWLGFTEEYSYPSHKQIEEMFQVAQQIGATVIRSHTLGFSGGSPNSLRPFDNNLNDNAWEPIDYAFSMANVYNIKLIVPLIDGYNYYHGSYGEFCKTRNVPKDSFWTDVNVRQDFKKYIQLWLNHKNQYTNILIKNDPSLFLIELGNELGNIRPSANSNSVPTEEWIRDISSYIKTIDKNHLVLHGVDESLGQSNDFSIGSLDAYSGHFYGKDYNRIDFGSGESNKINKPYIIGEYDSNFDNDWFTEIEKRNNVKGTVFWSMYPHTNGFMSGSPIPHNDGYTIHYPESSSQLTRIQNHFRRMKSRINSK